MKITFVHWDRFQGELIAFENMKNRTASVWNCLGGQCLKVWVRLPAFSGRDRR
jgi:hypothetical protein